MATRVSDYLDIYIVYKPVAIAAGFFYLNMNTRIIGNHSEQIVADYLDIKLEYQGFCIVTLLNKRGLLVSGRPAIVAKYNDGYSLMFCHTETI